MAANFLDEDLEQTELHFRLEHTQENRSLWLLHGTSQGPRLADR